MKLAKVPFHLVQQGLTRQAICKEAAPEWKTTFIRITGNTVHYLSITGKVSTQKFFKNAIIAISTVKRPKGIVDKQVCQRHKGTQQQQHALTGVQPVQWWKRGWKYDDATNWNITIWCFQCRGVQAAGLYVVQAVSSCSLLCSTTEHRISAMISIYDNAVVIFVSQSQS